MTVFLKDQYTLELTQGWDTLGMRGTCSEGYIFKGEAPAEQIFPKPFAEIAAQSMLASSHLLWGGVWYGIAVDAVVRAQAFVRAAARKTPGQTPLGCPSSGGSVQSSAARAFGSHRRSFPLRGGACQSGPAVLHGICCGDEQCEDCRVPDRSQDHRPCHADHGNSWLQEWYTVQLGRHLRDAQSAQLMISNDRILANTSNMLLIHKIETGLLG